MNIAPRFNGLFILPADIKAEQLDSIRSVALNAAKKGHEDKPQHMYYQTGDVFEGAKGEWTHIRTSADQQPLQQYVFVDPQADQVVSRRITGLKLFPQLSSNANPLFNHTKTFSPEEQNAHLLNELADLKELSERTH